MMPSSKSPGSSISNGYQDLHSRPKIRVELAVNISEQKDLNRIDHALKSKGLELASSDLQGKTIQLELSDTTVSELRDVRSLQRFIEQQTGIITVVKGLGRLNSAVAELAPSSSGSGGQRVMGVIRISQLTESTCFIDGLIDGFKHHVKQECRHSVAIHEFGDLSGDKFENVGEPIIDIHECVLDKSKRNPHSMSISKIVPNCDVSNIIGKSIAVIEYTRELYDKNILSAGVIARASIIEANTKKFCSCSGKTLWEERLDKKEQELN